MNITIARSPMKPTEPLMWQVSRGDTLLAVVSFNGPSGTIVMHQGTLQIDEQEELHRLYENDPWVCRFGV
jgi:hypothetical protein